jgi:hypothetical protein
VSPPWSSELAGALQRDQQRLLVAFVELRARLRESASANFAGGEAERSRALEQTEHDYVALVAAGAEAARLVAELESADRQATVREADTAALVIRQMRELVDAVASRPPPGDDPIRQS